MKKLLWIFIILAFTKTSVGQEVNGFREVVFSVSDLERSVKFYKEVAGWEVFKRGFTKSGQAKFWGLKKNTRIEEVLLRNNGTKKGYLRLVKFHGVKQRQIRSSGRTWDTGGIFNVNTRVKDIYGKFAEMQKRGWNAYSDPQRFEFGRFKVAEVLVKGPDGVVVALIQRFAPPLEGFPNLRDWSHLFNSTQIVRDIEKSHEFYVDKLGFQVYIFSDGSTKKNGPNVLGLPNNLAGTINRKVYIVHPKKNNFGSVELLQFEGAVGEDFSEFAVPPNLGILMLRFPVKGLEKFAQTIMKKGVKLEKPITKIHLAPYGKIKVFAVRSPDGAWIEFFEELN